uniref:Uncharacterized protein n=1 Tax=Pavo cristatus TaxID=9049 RepID=A0A8C9FRJ8_PAVCR
MSCMYLLDESHVIPRQMQIFAVGIVHSGCCCYSFCDQKDEKLNKSGNIRNAAKDASQEESESIPEYTAEEEREDNRLWRTVVIGEQEQRIDMKVIEPYKKVISHGGYYGDGLNAIIVFAACFLPDSSRTDYNYVMENLFL